MQQDTPNNGEKSIAYSPRLMSQVAIFPLQNPGDARFVERSNGCVSVATMPSRWGWAYGRIPRLFLIYVRSLIQTNSDKIDMERRTVRIDGSFRSFCEEIGLAEGTGMEDVERSLLCLSGMTFNVTLKGETPDGATFMEGRNMRIVSRFHLRFPNTKGNYLGPIKDDDPASYIEFSEEMWRILTENSTPLNRRIALNLGKSARALDIYQWLAYRSYNLRKPAFVPWGSVRLQFDSEDTPMYAFRQRFRKALQKVCDAWPEARVVCGKDGLTVFPCMSSIESQTRTEAEGETDSLTRANPFA